MDLLKSWVRRIKKISGTRAGGIKARQRNIEKYGPDFYKRIGRKGGSNGKGENYTGGFASNKVGEDGLTGRQRAVLAGAIGGHTSRRGPAKKDLEEEIGKAAK